MTLPRPFVRSELTERVVRRFLELKPKEMVSWAELSRLLGMDAQKEGRHHVESAKRILLSEDKKVCETILGEGVCLFDDHAIIPLGGKYRRKIRNAAHRGKRKLLCADVQQLTAEELQEHRASLVTINLQQQFAGPRGYESLKANVNAGQYQPPPLDPDMFRGA